MAKGRIIKKNVVTREKNKFYFVDGNGNLRAITRNTKGAKKGHRTCRKPARKTRRHKR